MVKPRFDFQDRGIGFIERVPDVKSVHWMDTRNMEIKKRRGLGCRLFSYFFLDFE